MRLVDIYRTGATAPRAISVVRFVGQSFQFLTRQLTTQRKQVSRLLAPRRAIIPGRILFPAKQDKSIAIGTARHMRFEQLILCQLTFLISLSEREKRIHFVMD